MTMRSTKGYGGGGYGGRGVGGGMTLNFPPFTRMVIWLLGINTAFYLLLVLFRVIGPQLILDTRGIFALYPLQV